MNNNDLNLKQFKSKKNILSISTILMLSFVLVTVILLVFEMNRRVPKPEKDIEKVVGSERVGIVDSLYFNRPFYFTQTLVDPDWSMHIVTRDSVLDYVDTSKPLFEQIHWLLEMDDIKGGDTTASSLTGLLKWKDEPESKDIAITIMAEILDKYETNKDRALILVPATIPAHHVLIGHYWAILLPEKSNDKNVWVTSVMPRRNVTYIVLNRTRKDLYETYKPIFQKVNHGFKALSMLDKELDFQF